MTDDRVEETVWEYKALILDRDQKPCGPKTWVSNSISVVPVKNTANGSEQLYDTCQFGNESYHDIAYRVTKTEGLDFVPNHGVLKPQERVPLKFRLRKDDKCPSSVEIEILSIRVKNDTPGRIENKWQLVPSNRVSRTRHKIELKRQEDGGTAPPNFPSVPESFTVAQVPSDDSGVKASNTVNPEPPRRSRSPTVKKSKSRASQASCPTPNRPQSVDDVGQAKMERSSLFTLTNVVLVLLVATVLYLFLQVRALSAKVERANDFCSGRFCFWFLCP
ncbi:uncharacterized protein LOC135399634 isoform X2 [Ornithodoros turicata]|uniref:uncharacterized protein LOC135399634 isoform X2 n=1 Tax=Ornithodoros turicata TaxID=34597 RepID=UPI003139F6EE